jgi:hypothetical protein
LGHILADFAALSCTFICYGRETARVGRHLVDSLRTWQNAARFFLVQYTKTVGDESVKHFGRNEMCFCSQSLCSVTAFKIQE